MRVVNSWCLIENLGEDPAESFRVVAAAGQPKRWGSPMRLGAVGLRADETVRQALGTGERVEVVTGSVSGARRLVAIPVHGPGGVYGVQLWIGEPAAAVTPPRPVVAYQWSADDLLMRYSVGVAHRIRGARPAPVKVATAAEFTARVSRFDGGATIIAMGANPQPGQLFDGELTTSRGPVRRHWRSVARVWARPGQRGLRGISEDHSGLRDAGMSSTEPVLRPRAAVLLAFSQETAAVAAWLTVPPPWMAYRWGATHAGPGLLHPGDYSALQSARCALRHHTHICRTIRLPSQQGRWRAVQVYVRRFKDCPTLYVAEFDTGMRHPLIGLGGEI